MKLLVAVTVAIASCGDGGGTVAPQVDENAFIQTALQGNCANTKNKLYVIDQVMVLSDRAGSCADASYSQILYGTTVNDVYCRNQDSIAGPIKKCDVPIYQGLFDIMIANLSKPDLGLGSGHSVKALMN